MAGALSRRLPLSSDSGGGRIARSDSDFSAKTRIRTSGNSPSTQDGIKILGMCAPHPTLWLHCTLGDNLEILSVQYR